MTTIYNCHHDGDQYRITKFVDGNPESSYLCTHSECECPAGHRDTCRHRQMLPEMIDRGLVNSHLFLNWDHPARPTCDFEGNTSVMTLPEGLPAGVQAFGMDDLLGIHNAIAEAVGEPEAMIKPAPKPFRRI